MKQTVTINLAGQVYHIDEDAFEVLKAYLERVEGLLHTSREEVMMDIEARIAELFTQHFEYSHMQVANLMMVGDVIARLGEPEQIVGEDEGSETESQKSKVESETSETSETSVPEPVEGEPNEPTEPKKAKKRLYLDVEHQRLTGVCAGLAQYTGIDVTLIRIVFLLTALLWGTSLIIYILLWILVPTANTAAQRLEMQGVEPTAENIRREVESHSDASVPQNTGCLGSLFKGCLITFLLLILVPTLLAIIVALFGVTAAISILPIGVTSMAHTASVAGVGLAVCLLLFLTIPIAAIIYAVVARKQPQHTHRLWIWIIALILWLLSACGVWFSGFALHNVVDANIERIQDFADGVREQVTEMGIDVNNLQPEDVIRVLETLDADGLMTDESPTSTSAAQVPGEE